MPTDLPQIDPVDAKSCIEKAAHSFLGSTVDRPNGVTLTAALLTLEKSAKQSHLSIPAEALLGTWLLCFSAGKKAKFQSGQPVGNGFYVPQWAIAQISFTQSDSDDSSLAIANQLTLGPLTIRFTGPARYPGQKNLLVFDFTHLEVMAFGMTLYRGAVGRKKYKDKSFAATAIAQLPFFAFFSATDDWIAARGRGGGLAVWVKQKS